MSLLARCVLGLSVLGFLGCGSSGLPTGTVSGKLTIGGEVPKEKVKISYINSIIGQGAMAITDDDGSYTLDGPLRVGEYVVYFEKFLTEASGPVSTSDEALQTIPSEYRTEASSPMKQTVKEGANTILLELPKRE